MKIRVQGQQLARTGLESHSGSLGFQQSHGRSLREVGGILAAALHFCKHPEVFSWKAGSSTFCVMDTGQLRALPLPGLNFSSCKMGLLSRPTIGYQADQMRTHEAA